MLPGVLSGPGDGTLKFCGVRAAAGLCEGCGDGLGRKLLGDGAGPELEEEEEEGSRLEQRQASGGCFPQEEPPIKRPALT